MEDIVGLIVTDGQRGKVGLMTWGRVFDAIDEEPLIAAVKPHLAGFGLNSVKSVDLCTSLQAISTAEYFYEGLLYFMNAGITYGKGYEKWAHDRRSEIESGREIYCVGKVLP
jgi:hypothetical protein